MLRNKEDRALEQDQLCRSSGEVRAQMLTKADLAQLKASIPKFISIVYGLQTLAILGGVAALFRLRG
jgi:hypothetical protein